MLYIEIELKFYNLQPLFGSLVRIHNTLRTMELNCPNDELQGNLIVGNINTVEIMRYNYS